jgi:serine/threonine-protein kinase
MQLPERYEYAQQVKKGGFGLVSICNDKHLERLVAIKSIENKNELHRIRDELDALLSMRSKHVVQVFDLIYERDAPIGIVEEYIQGDDLCESKVPQQSTDSYIKSLWQIASGIADIHSAGIIHRDIKPNNMKYDTEGIIKIFDFGLSRNVSKNANTVGFKGTLEFSAPEQSDSDQNNKVHFTQAIDVYAFGVMTGYLVDHELPSLNFNNTRWQILNKSIELKLGFLPTELQSVFLRCLNVDPTLRPEMALVRDVIAKYLLQNKHQAIAILNNEPKFLNKDIKRVNLSWKDIGAIEIVYDEFVFSVKSVSGETYINNVSAKVGDQIPGACVVTIGAPSRHYTDRAFIPFDTSHPEVVL